MADARVIKRAKNIKDGLAKILALAPIQYKNRDADPTFEAGFISQDFAKVFPEFVSKTNDDGTSPLPPANPNLPGVPSWKIVSMEVLIPFMVGAFKEMYDGLDQLQKKFQKRVKEVDDKFAPLEARVTSLEGLVTTLQAQIVSNTDRITALERKLP